MSTSDDDDHAPICGGSGGPKEPASAIKAKRVLTEDQLEKLKYAREKAREKKLELGSVRAREKALKDKLLTDRIAALDLAEASPQRRGSKRHRSRRHSSSSDSSSDDSEEERRRRKRRRDRSDSKQDPKPVAIKEARDDSLTTAVVRDELQKRMLNKTYAQAFASMFPGKTNIYI